jgi:acyl-coenzyme A synthetase/AMP-(fatty) acid ligase
MKPTRVELTAKRLPRSPTGKVLRRALREPFWSGFESRIAGA